MISVIKLGGRVQSDPALISVLGEMWPSHRGSMCILHGGGDEISILQRALGREPSFIHGRRITTSEDIELVRMVLSGSANKRLVSELCAAGVPAVGVSGEDAGLISAEPIDVAKFGRAGKPVSASAGVLHALLSAGFLPVISPVATDVTSPKGDALNVNGDDAAAVIAAALRAELWLIADVAGVLGANGDVLDSLDPAEVDSLVADGTVNSGMRAKLEAGFDALAAGAAGVRIGGLDTLRGKSIGTSLSLTPSIR
jgi:acetylglutamate kinase